MRYELTDLRIFMAIADAQSLTKGALAMHVTAPSASYRLKNFENALGVVLFNRMPRGMTLTAAGEAVYKYGRIMVAKADELQAEMARYNSTVTGNIRVFANSSTLSSLPIPVSRFLASYPSINIELEEHLSADSVKAVHEGDADIGLVAGVIHLRGLESLSYGQDELVLVTPLDHPLSLLEKIIVEDALDYDFVSVGHRSSNFLYLQKIATMLGKRVNVRVHMQDFDAALRCVQEGVGISLMPRSVVKASTETKRISVTCLDEPWAKRNQLIVTRPRSTLNAHTQALIHFLTES